MPNFLELRLGEVVRSIALLRGWAYRGPIEGPTRDEPHQRTDADAPGDGHAEQEGACQAHHEPHERPLLAPRSSREGMETRR